jgi:hypothetical protein
MIPALVVTPAEIDRALEVWAAILQSVVGDPVDAPALDWADAEQLTTTP